MMQIHPNQMWFFAVSAWIGSVCGFDFTNRTKLNQTAV